MKNLFIYCDGGFGNRYGTLIGGLHVAKYHKFNPVIVWRNTSNCRLKFNKIFVNDIEVCDKPLDAFSDCVLMMHGNFVTGYKNYDINSFESIDDLPVNDEKVDYLYNNNWIPQWMEEKYVMTTIKELVFIDSIKHFSDIFTAKKGIDAFTIGLHLRATDFDKNVPQFNKEYDWIAGQPDQKFFVLSDDEDLEKKFNKLDNVVVRKKQHYVEKEDPDASWCGNIERSSDSVMDSLIDLTVFSKTNILVNSPSSFLKTALLLKKYG